jgi:hypothetical protein
MVRGANGRGFIKSWRTTVASNASLTSERLLKTSRFLGVLVLLAVLVGTLLVLLHWYIAPSGAGQKKDVVATLAQLEETIGDEYTQLDPNFKRPAHWGAKTGEHPKED